MPSLCLKKFQWKVWLPVISPWINVSWALCRNVGFLRYFQVKQIPNFLLASPILILAVLAIFVYGRSQPRLLFLLGFDIPPSQWQKLALLPDNIVAKKQVTGDEPGESTALASGAVHGIFLHIHLNFDNSKGVLLCTFSKGGLDTCYAQILIKATSLRLVSSCKLMCLHKVQSPALNNFLQYSLISYDHGLVQFWVLYTYFCMGHNSLTFLM